MVTLVSPEDIGDMWAALRRAEGSRQLCLDAAASATGAALALEEASANLRRALRRCGALQPEGGEAA
jgi:hypothetical protein